MKIIKFLLFAIVISGCSSASSQSGVGGMLVPIQRNHNTLSFNQETVRLLFDKIKLLRRGDTSARVMEVIDSPPYAYGRVLSKKADESKGYVMTYFDHENLNRRPHEEKMILFYFSVDERLSCVLAPNIPELDTLMPCNP